MNPNRSLLVASTAGVALGLVGCVPPGVTGSSLRTEAYLLRDRKIPQTHLSLVVPGTPASVARKLMEVSSACLQKETDVSATSGAGGIQVHQTIRTHWSSEEVESSSGHWVALRMDSSFGHGVPIALELRARTDVETDVVVYRADQSKAKAISDRIIDGSLFCNWRDISYPYD